MNLKINDSVLGSSSFLHTNLHGAPPQLDWTKSQPAQDGLVLSSGEDDWTHPVSSSLFRGEAREEKLLKIAGKLRLLLGIDPGHDDIAAAIRLIETEFPEVWIVFQDIPPKSLIGIFTQGGRGTGTAKHPPNTSQQLQIRSHNGVKG